MAQRILRMTVAYDGTGYAGWQRQKKAPTIQAAIEKALAKMTGEPVTLHGAGRTDAGVHARAMVAHFQTAATIPEDGFLLGLNSLLPGAIRIVDLQSAPAGFHARYDAIAKEYGYFCRQSRVMPPCERLYALHIPWELDLEAMGRCCALLVGEHDFSCFEGAGSRPPGSGSAVRTLYRAELRAEDDGRFWILLEGSGFLRHMVRNIVGTLLQVGRAQRTIAQFQAVLESCDRSQAGPTAPAHGLFLLAVKYPQDS